MRRRIRTWQALVMAVATAAILASAGAAAAAGWEFLGERKVAHGLDRDEIRVTAREGRFRQIQLRVRVAAVTFRDVKVHFGDGSVQDVELRRTIPAGGETRAIDLEGGNRVIEKVVFWYNTRPARRKQATVRLFGR